ncbi:MAG: 2-dehydropantoate 2-reductase, partial [Hyphomicrobiaceae bacterium]
QKDDLHLHGPDGEIRVTPTNATDNPAGLDPVDVVLFCVKLYDADEAANLIRPIVGPDTLVVSLMNGVDGPARIAEILGTGHVLGGAAYDSATISGPGVVQYRKGPNRLVLGELSGGNHPKTRTFADAGIKAGFDVQISANIQQTLWEKYVLLATNAGLTALIRQPVGVVYKDPDMRRLATEMMAEVVAVAEASGITLSPDIIERSLTLLDTFSPDMYASAYFDLANGKRMEVGSFSGLIARLGDEYSVPTPHHRTVYACLKPYLNGAPA